MLTWVPATPPSITGITATPITGAGTRLNWQFPEDTSNISGVFVRINGSNTPTATGATDVTVSGLTSTYLYDNANANTTDRYYHLRPIDARGRVVGNWSSPVGPIDVPAGSAEGTGGQLVYIVTDTTVFINPYVLGTVYDIHTLTFPGTGINKPRTWLVRVSLTDSNISAAPSTTNSAAEFQWRLIKRNVTLGYTYDDAVDRWKWATVSRANTSEVTTTYHNRYPYIEKIFTTTDTYDFSISLCTVWSSATGTWSGPNGYVGRVSLIAQELV